MVRRVVLIAACALPAGLRAQDSGRAPREISLPGVTVLSDYARFKRDSVARRVFYRKELNDAVSKPQLDPTNPLAVNGLFSELALRLSGKKKKYRRFKARMEADEAERFTAIRYNSRVVTNVTGLPDSGAVQFIREHPMPEAFARSAGELEFLQWIRDRQRESRWGTRLLVPERADAAARLPLPLLMNREKRLFDNILQTIGDTPLVRLNRVCADLPCPVYAKIEYGNPGNSIKDRMALKMVEVAEQEGKIKPGGTIIEGTSGNTGMGLAIAAIIKGYKCIFTTTDKQSKEKADILRAMGAQVIVCPTNVEPEDPRSYYSVSKRLASEVPNSWYVNQYDNLANRQAHYESTAPEIWDQTDGKVTHVVVASGTGGTITGIGQFMKEKNPAVQMWAIDSYGSLLKKWHETGELDMNEVYPYISEGFGEDFLPQNYIRDTIDHFEKVTDKDGAVMARRIAKEEGIFVGYSAGSVIAGLNQLKDKLKPTDLVVVVFHDHGSRYVGKVYNDEWMLERGFLDVNTVKDLLGGLGRRRLVTVSKDQTVREAMELMKKYDIEQVPVLEGLEPVGAITQGGLFKKLMQHAELPEQAVSAVMEAPLPVVPMETPVDRLGGYLNKETGAVLARDESGEYHILTQFDVLNALAKG